MGKVDRGHYVPVVHRSKAYDDEPQLGALRIKGRTRMTECVPTLSFQVPRAWDNDFRSAHGE